MGISARIVKIILDALIACRIMLATSSLSMIAFQARDVDLVLSNMKIVNNAQSLSVLCVLKVTNWKITNVSSFVPLLLETVLNAPSTNPINATCVFPHTPTSTEPVSKPVRSRTVRAVTVTNYVLPVRKDSSTRRVIIRVDLV